MATKGADDLLIFFGASAVGACNKEKVESEGSLSLFTQEVLNLKICIIRSGCFYFGVFRAKILLRLDPMRDFLTRLSAPMMT